MVVVTASQQAIAAKGQLQATKMMTAPFTDTGY